MSQLCFNDLSSFPLCQNDKEVEDRISLYVATIKEARIKLDLKRIRYPGDMDKVPVSTDMTLQDYCNTHNRDPKTLLLLSTHTKPQVDDDDDSILSHYLETSATINISEEIKNADGFNAGFCQGVPCIGFGVSVWLEKSTFIITVTSGDKVSTVTWGCISTPEHVNSNEFRDWYTSISPIELLCSPLTPSDKQIKLRHDHGYDILLEHANLLVRCNYVDGIINSLPFKRHTKSYIHKVYDNGWVDIVMYWHDDGYSMRVQTTGRNIREAKKIALLIEKEYCRR